MRRYSAGKRTYLPDSDQSVEIAFVSRKATELGFYECLERRIYIDELEEPFDFLSGKLRKSKFLAKPIKRSRFGTRVPRMTCGDQQEFEVGVVGCHQSVDQLIDLEKMKRY